MRLLVKLFVPIAVVVIAAVGLLPPVFARGNLDSDTIAAARAGSTALSGSTGGEAEREATAAAIQSLAGHRGVTVASVTVSGSGLGSVVTVTTSEHVRSFLENVPGLKGWFNITSTQTSQLGQ